jgi:hypothetical protein
MLGSHLGPNGLSWTFLELERAMPLTSQNDEPSVPQLDSCHQPHAPLRISQHRDRCEDRELMSQTLT